MRTPSFIPPSSVPLTRRGSRATPSAAGRDHTLDFCKGVLICLVVFGHTLQFFAYGGRGFWSDPIFKFIYMFHMPLFIGISGYLAFGSIQRSAAGPFIAARIQTYLVPIFAWAIVYKVGEFLLFRPTSLRALPVATLHEAIDSLWFVWSVFAALVLTMLVARNARRFFLPAYILSCVVVWLVPDHGNLFLFKYVYPFFQLGYLLAARAWKPGPLPNWFLGVASVVTVAAYLKWNTSTYIYNSKMALTAENARNILLRYIAGVAASALMFAIIRGWHERAGAATRSALGALGRGSLYIYILQGYVFIGVTQWVSHRPAFDLGSMRYPAAIAVAAVIVAGTWLAGDQLSRSEWLGRIFFGRTRKPAASRS